VCAVANGAIIKKILVAMLLRSRTIRRASAQG